MNELIKLKKKHHVKQINDYVETVYKGIYYEYYKIEIHSHI